SLRGGDAALAGRSGAPGAARGSREGARTGAARSATHVRRGHGSVRRVSPGPGRMMPASKDIFDRVAALVGVVMAIPVMVLIALVIKLQHPSLPLLFVETVAGKDAVPFRFYKFRTMLP